MTYHTFTRKCDGNCDWCDCDESVRLPEDDPRDPPEFGCCLPPGECCILAATPQAKKPLAYL